MVCTRPRQKLDYNYFTVRRPFYESYNSISKSTQRGKRMGDFLSHSCTSVTNTTSVHSSHESKLEGPDIINTEHNSQTVPVATTATESNHKAAQEQMSTGGQGFVDTEAKERRLLNSDERRR